MLNDFILLNVDENNTKVFLFEGGDVVYAYSGSKSRFYSRAPVYETNKLKTTRKCYD